MELCEKENQTRIFLQIVFIIACIAATVWLELTLHGDKGIDFSGWIEHHHDTPVWIDGEWLGGEYRVCQMPNLHGQQLPSSAHLLCGQGEGLAVRDEWPTAFMSIVSDHEFYGLLGSNWQAVDHHFHVMPVSYWGRIDRSEGAMFSWRCKREESSLECKALD